MKREPAEKKSGENSRNSKAEIKLFCHDFWWFFCLFTNWERILTWVILKYDLTV